MSSTKPFTEILLFLIPSPSTRGSRWRWCGCPPPSVEGRREAIAVALRNLVENGLRVTPGGDVVVGPGARLSVIDGGPGLAPARLPALPPG